MWLTGLDFLLGVEGDIFSVREEGLNLDFPNITWMPQSPCLPNHTTTFPVYMGFANLLARCRLELDHLRAWTASPGCLFHHSAEWKSKASPKKGHSDFSIFQWNQALSGLLLECWRFGESCCMSSMCRYGDSRSLLFFNLRVKELTWCSSILSLALANPRDFTGWAKS